MLIVDVTEFLVNCNFSDAELESNGARSTINEILTKLVYKIFFIVNIVSDGPEADSADVALVNFGVENVIDINFLCK